jgi:hypothetical protein
VTSVKKSALPSLAFSFCFCHPRVLLGSLPEGAPLVVGLLGTHRRMNFCDVAGSSAPAGCSEGFPEVTAAESEEDPRRSGLEKYAVATSP